MKPTQLLNILIALVIVSVVTPEASAHYRPGIGRWMERDPLEYADGMNLVLHTDSNPIVNRDYLGLQSEYEGTATQVYCRAAEKYPKNQWLQCACHVSNQINAAIYANWLAAMKSSGWVNDRATSKNRQAKAKWFRCMNTCMAKHWRRAYKRWQGEPLTPDEEELILPKWREYCSGCPGNLADSYECCAVQVGAEQEGFDKCTEECGKYDSQKWGPPAGDETDKLMPGWDINDDFNDYDARVRYGIGLCCKKPPAATQPATQPDGPVIHDTGPK